MKEEGLYYPCSKNKGADQLRGYRKADLRLCFRICRFFFFFFYAVALIMVKFGIIALYRSIMLNLFLYCMHCEQKYAEYMRG